MENNQNQLVGLRGLIIKDELVRLITQCLYSLQYNDSASRLEAESNISYKSPQFVRLQTAVENGNGEESIRVLVEIKDFFATKDDRARALKSIVEQWMRENLFKNDVKSALSVLRRDYSELEVKKEKWHGAAMVLISKNNEQEVGEDAIAEMRRELIRKLEKELLPQPIVVEENRLISILEMHLEYAKHYCMYHNKPGGISMVGSHMCSKDHFPTTTLQTLVEHKDEVWFVKFSNNGNLLASSSKDLTAIIWEVPEQGDFMIKRTLVGHGAPVAFASWRTDDKVLATCGHEEVVKIWDVETGACIRTLDEYRPALSSCCWIPYSRELVFVYSGPDSSIYKFNMDTGDLKELQQNVWGQITDIVIAGAGESHMLCSYANGSVFRWDLTEEYGFHEQFNVDSPITSLSLSDTGKYLLVNQTGKEIKMFDVSGDVVEVISFHGYKQARYAIRSCFGGLGSRLIASGSEDSQIYIWNRAFRYPIEVLSGHSMLVNSVSWNPVRPAMLASASDDRTIRIWGPKPNQKNASA